MESFLGAVVSIGLVSSCCGLGGEVCLGGVSVIGGVAGV